MNEIMKGMKRSIPIALGYFPVAFSFGVLCVSSGLPLGFATFISLTNLTSSGQFAGVQLILSDSTYLEIAITLLLINFDEKMNTIERMIISFGITDETFALASLQPGKLTFKFMLGFILTPIIGWVGGTLAGEFIMDLLPLALQGAMGIALYGMFLALIVPAMKESMPVTIVVLISIGVHTLFTYVPLFNVMSTGVRLISATLIATCMGAWLFPREDEA